MSVIYYIGICIEPHLWSIPGFGSRREIFSNKNRKNCKEIGNNFNFIQIFRVNLHKLYNFFLLNNLLRFFNKKKLFISLFFYKMFKLDPNPDLKSSWIRIRNKGMRIHRPGIKYIYLFKASSVFFSYEEKNIWQLIGL